jgi:hypothetical protein
MNIYVDEYPNWISGPANLIPNAILILAFLVCVFFVYRSRFYIWFNVVVTIAAAGLIFHLGLMYAGYAFLAFFFISPLIVFVILKFTRKWQTHPWRWRHIFVFVFAALAAAIEVPLYKFVFDWHDTHSLGCAQRRFASPHGGVLGRDGYSVCYSAEEITSAEARLHRLVKEKYNVEIPMMDSAGTTRP